MQAKDFYTSDCTNAITIKFITKSKLSQLTADIKIKNLLAALNFHAKAGEVAPIFDINGEITEILIGVGEKSDNKYLAKSINKLPAGTYMLAENAPEMTMLAWSLEQYKFTKYKQAAEKTRVLFLADDIRKSIILKAQSIFLIRDLINTPTCDLSPADLANTMRGIAKEYSAKFTEIIGDDLCKHNFPAIYTVGKGSSSAPRLLSLEWGDNNNHKVTLVGKGVCFDSGGLDLKSSSDMRIMKKDMGGAAHVLGLAKWIMAENIPIKLQVLIPAVENSIDGNAYRPGDVIRMRNGLTVEIENTDAEGRLVLADALSLACEEKPDIIFDFATLTGAARIAVGTGITAMFCNDDELAESLYKNGNLTDDPIWRMPLFAQYNSLFESDIADMANASKTAYGGAITAALFLQKFITDNVSWVHFDMMAWNLSASPGKPVGGEAMGFLAVAKYLKDRF